MKCTLCGNKIDPLKYTRLKISEETKIKVLGEKVKNRETVMDLRLCNDCSVNVRSFIIQKQCEVSTDCEHKCDNDCVQCDGAR